MSSRPSVPADVKRQLRQEAGFGCVQCGHPFIQYHHIISWEEEHHFRPEDMTVFCGNCHYLCSTGALGQNEQRKLKARPKNIADNMLRGALFVNAAELVVHFGGGRAIETPNLLTMSNQPVLTATMDKSDGRVLLSAVIQDKKGHAIAALVDNEWTVQPSEVWDFEVFPMHAKVRNGPADIAFAVDVRNDQVELRGKWYRGLMEIEFSPTKVQIGSNTMTGFNVSHCGTFLSV
jgi:hypothetical protein